MITHWQVATHHEQETASEAAEHYESPGLRVKSNSAENSEVQRQDNRKRERREEQREKQRPRERGV
jgi:hypothetical protein